jgi:hypothetical protein
MEQRLSRDGLDRLTRDFGDRADPVAALLVFPRRSGGEDFLDDHLVRCIVHAASGDEQRVEKLLDLARQDYRDVILAGEYDDAMRQVRDLRDTFLIDDPEKFWAVEMACLMASRGYHLTALQTRSLTAGPFVYTSDLGEGRATFIGPKGEIVIEKKDRRWSIQRNRRDLTIHDLDHAYGDEQAFRDAVSGYLLSKISARAVVELNEVPPVRGLGRSWWRSWK